MDSSREQTSPEPPRTVDSAEILKGHREVLIQHGDQYYRLRVTDSGKLILQK